MAVKASIATGNFLTAGTWGVVDATSYLNAENATESLLTTAYSGTRSSAFTPGAITVSHIGVKLCERIGTTGTMSVSLRNSTIGLDDFVAGTEVTIDVADLPSALEADLNGGWIFFKLATPVLLLAANNYNVQAKTSSATQVDLWCDGTADNISRALITTTTGAPAAGDDLIVAGEKTGAGTENNFVVTMDETAATDYGAASTSLVTPSMAICSGGTLQYGTTAATNYVLRQSGNVIVYSEGTLNIGTTGTPLPRDGSAVLEFDCAADGDFGLVVRNGGTFNAQGLSRTVAKLIDRCLLNTDEAAAQTTLGVDTDTGWLTGDEVGIASTSRTNTECEKRVLNGAAGASSFDITAGLTNAHSGTSPTQAEVILLTRNVRIRSVSSTAMAYINFKATATVDMDWVEMYYLGEAATAKRAVEIETTTGSVNIARCCLHDTEDGGFHLPSANEGAITLANNVLYNINTAGTALSAFHIANASTLSTISFTGNIVMLTTGASSSGFNLRDLGGTVTGNTAVGCAGEGFDLAESGTSANVVGTMNTNVAHSNNFSGLAISNPVLNSTIQSFTLWRNNSSSGGFRTGGVVAGCTFDGFVMFGNNASNVFISGGLSHCLFKDFVCSGDSTFSTTSGVAFQINTNSGPLFFEGCTFGVVSGIKTAHSSGDINLNVSSSITEVYLRNCLLDSATDVVNQTVPFAGTLVSSQKHDQTAGLHKTWKKYGTITIEGTTVHTGSQSVKLTPNNASSKLEGPSFFIAVASGATLTPTVYVYEDAAYNGARARLIVKKNVAAGIAADAVLDTATAASDEAWEGLTGTTAAVTDDAVLEFVVDCDGTAGNVFIDSATVA